MKKSIMIIALALVPFLMKAQMPMGMPMGMGMGAPTMQDLPEQTIPVVLPPEAEKAMNEAANEANKTDMAAMAEAFNNMTSEDREKMMSSMQDMENMMAQVEDNQLAYEDGLKSILTKKQMRA